jgi:hypothetical protein
LLRALPDAYGVALLSAGREGALPSDAAIDAILAAARRAVDLVVIDAGRPHWPTLGRLRPQGVVAAVLVSAELRGAAAGRRAAAHLESWLPDRRMIARTGNGREASAEQVAEAVGLPLLATLADDAKAAAAMERGEPPSMGTRSAFRSPVHQLLETMGVPLRAPR